LNVKFRKETIDSLYYLFVVIVTRSWQLHNVSSLVVKATFGHSSAYDPVSGLIYVHGGFRESAGNNAEISSDLNAYIPSKNKW
jgi:hypothetical protein